MAYSALIQILDRLTVRSVLRGSTSTICGILGTLAVIILCLAIYIPPTINYFQGNYFESEFWTNDLVNQKYYSNDDFKIAIQLRKKSDNSVADHQAILQWGYSEFSQLLSDWSEEYVEPAAACQADYLADAINPVYLEDCFIFPQYKMFDVFAGLGVYTPYSNIFYYMYPKADLNPFSSISGGPIQGNRGQMEKIFKDYYYIVYFTSKVVDQKTGKYHFQVNRFYSTETAFNENIGSTVDIMIYNVKNYTLDNSIMPWSNNLTKNGLTWLGQSFTLGQFSVEASSFFGIEVDFSLNQYSVMSYRYYKKLDWLFGIIGGAMLLFYIIFWVPCNYIARTLHQMNNVSQLLLINHAEESEPITEEKVTAAKVSNWYWVSNFITNKLFKSAESADNLVKAGERELDIVKLVKKMKVVERTLAKKKMLQPFEPKILYLETLKLEQDLVDDQESKREIQDNQSQQIVQSQMIVQDDIVELPTDPTFGLTQTQKRALKNEPFLKKVYQDNMTAAVVRNDGGQTTILKQIEGHDKHSAIYPSKRKISRARIVFDAFVGLIRYFDMFGAKPNLIAAPHGSSLVGLCGTVIIITLSIITFALTIHNSSVPQVMTLDRYLDQNNFGYSLTTGSTLKFALCFDLASKLVGSNKLANLRFFTNSKQKGMQYILPVQLSSADYSSFDLTSTTSPVDLDFCFGIEPNHLVQLGLNDTNFGYFGFVIEPYCSSTAAFCSSNAATINSNFYRFINNTLTYLFLPENRFDPITKTFKNNLVYQDLNINLRYMQNMSAFEETLFVDEVRIEDDTKNWFMRKQPEITFKGLAKNEYASYPISRNIPGSPYYKVNIKPSGNQIRYLLSTKKADTLLGIIGGVFVLFYAIFHGIGKVYNTFNVKAKLAEQIYDEQAINQNSFTKILAISPLPSCLITTRFGLKYDVARIRQTQKKMNNDLNYLWLVKYVDNLYSLSSSLFDKRQAKNLSLVFVKDKIDESQQVVARGMRQEARHNQQEFNDEIDIGGGDIGEKINFSTNKKNNKVLNESGATVGIDLSNANFEDSAYSQKVKATQQVIEFGENGIEDRMQDNHIYGNPKQPRFNMLDTFEYPASLTLHGQRQVTSFCGGCCCLIMVMFIAIIASFQVSVYLNRSDIRVGRATQIMQPLSSESNSSYNSNLTFITGNSFKLAVTFSSNYADYPHNVSNWTSSAVGISVYQQTYTRSNGTVVTATQEFPFKPCSSDYLQPIDPLIDPAYYTNTQFGYCIADGIGLQISGLPEDNTTKRFTLSIFNKLGTMAGNQQLKLFMHNYLPKIHFSSPTLDFSSKNLSYQISSFTFESFNVSYPKSQNLTFAKMSVLFDDQIAFEGDPYIATTYVALPFQQFQTQAYDEITGNMSYNLSFANSYLVLKYTVVGDKFYETFGIIGGLVAIFIFALGVCPRGFNQYRMQYLIGKQLYLFDILKKKEAMAVARGRKRKSNQQLLSLRNHNDIDEIQLLFAYILSFFAKVVSNYNISTTLRRVTLIQQRVIKDINLFEVYRKIHNTRDALNKHFSQQGHSQSLRLTDIYLKHIYDPNPDQDSLVNDKIVSFAKKHGWSSFEQFAVFDALRARVNLKEVFDNAFLEKAFNMEGLDRNSIHLSQFGGTQGSIGTNSVAESVAEPSEAPKEQQFKIQQIQ